MSSVPSEIASIAAQDEAWEEHKAAERRDRAQATGAAESVLDGVALALPALLRADKIQKRAARIGFDWPDARPVFDKLKEEIAELESRTQKPGPSAAPWKTRWATPFCRGQPRPQARYRSRSGTAACHRQVRAAFPARRDARRRTHGRHRSRIARSPVAAGQARGKPTLRQRRSDAHSRTCEYREMRVSRCRVTKAYLLEDDCRVGWTYLLNERDEGIVSCQVVGWNSAKIAVAASSDEFAETRRFNSRWRARFPIAGCYREWLPGKEVLIVTYAVRGQSAGVPVSGSTGSSASSRSAS